MPRSTAPPAPRKARSRKITSLPARTLLDAAEDAGDTFAEASEHIVRQRRFKTLSLGPVVDVPMTELAPGSVGWRRAVFRRRSVAGSAGDPPKDAAELYCLLVPAGVGRRHNAHASGFLRGIPADQFVAEARCRAWPHRAILARRGTGVPPAALRQLVEAVSQEIAEE